MESLSIIKKEIQKPFYQGSNYTDYVRIMFDKQPNNWSPVITYLLPNGRTIGPKFPVGINSGENREIVENGITYYYFDFFLSTKEGMLAIAGQLQMSIALNYVESDGSIIRKGVASTFVNTIVKTTVLGEENIIVLGDNPEQLVLDFINSLNALSQRQTTIETIWSSQVSKLIPVIKNLLENSKDTWIEFKDNGINVIHLGETILEISEKSGVIIKTGGLIIDGEQDIRCNGDLIIGGTSRLKDMSFTDAHGENIVSDDIRSLDGTIQDTLRVGKKLYLGEINIQDKLNEIIQNLLRLSSVIVNQLDEEEASINFSDESITFKHLGKNIARFSDNDGIYFYDTTEFRETIDAKKDLFLKGESLTSILETLQSNYEEAKTYTYRKIEQEVKDRNAAIEALKSSLIDGAPQALDTLLELSRALGNDPNFATTITNLISQKYEDSKKFTEDNFIRTEDLPMLLSNLTEADLTEVFKGVYD